MNRIEGKHMKHETPSTPQFLQKEADHTLEMDISSVKTLQIGYHGETLFLHAAEDNTLIVKEYIGGLSGSEYYAKVTANRIKTTIRYGRREEVNRDTYVEIFLPKDWHGELQLSSQYGDIRSDADWSFERFAAETMEGSIFLKGITAPRIHMSTPVGTIQFEYAEGFVDIHSVSGSIIANIISGGAKLATSGGSIRACFHSLNNIIECNTLNGDIDLSLPKDTGINVDGTSKTGTITSEIQELSIKTKPGNIKNITGILGEKPFQNLRISTINGNILLH